MKFQATFILLLILLHQLTAQSTERTLPTIRQVTVFRNGCQIEREASVLLKQGTQVLVFSGFGSGFDQNSVQVKPPTSVCIARISF